MTVTKSQLEYKLQTGDDVSEIIDELEIEHPFADLEKGRKLIEYIQYLEAKNEQQK